MILDRFIASFAQAPVELILDFDATDDPVHGRQEGRFFHGYYDHYCFLPLYVFCGEQLLVSYLRPSKIDGAKHAWAILALLLVKRLRRAWPKVRIILRGDSGFCRQKMLNWCDRHGVGYCVGLAKNDWLNARTQARRDCLKARHEATHMHPRAFMEFTYAAESWQHPWRDGEPHQIHATKCLSLPLSCYPIAAGIVCNMRARDSEKKNHFSGSFLTEKMPGTAIQ